MSYWLVVEPTHTHSQTWLNSCCTDSWHLQTNMLVTVLSQASDCRRSAYSMGYARWHSARHASCVSW